MSEKNEPVKEESRVTLAALLAIKAIPDHHAFPLKLYVGDSNERPFSEWMSLYEEMMAMPTGMTKEEWHREFSKKGR